MSNYDLTYRAEKTILGNTYQSFVEDVFRYYMDIQLNCYKKKIEQYLIGENKAGIEIKNDSKLKVRGSLWIEYAEKARPRPGDYAKSGIFRNDNSWLFAIGNYDIIYLFGIKTLRRVYSRNLEVNKFEWVNTPTSRCFLLPLENALQLAEKVIVIGDDFRSQRTA